MKRFKLILAVMAMALGICSCGSENDDSMDYLALVGTWGVKTIQYYNLNYWGNPIENTIETYEFTPGDPIDGIDLVFKEDRSGKKIDRSSDTVMISTTQYVVSPDTVVVSQFNYSYHKDENIIYMTMLSNLKTHKLRVLKFTDKEFTYEYEYKKNYAESAHLVRISNSTNGKAARRSKPVAIRPRREGSLLSN